MFIRQFSFPNFIITVCKNMIRNNKQAKSKYSTKKLHIYNYRNALYQGQICKDNGQRQGKGIIYITDNHHFIACNQFLSNKLNGQCFFFHSHSKYHYGNWLNNQPHGLSVFRMNQILIITEYKQGLLDNGSRILLMLERYNLGIILEVIDDSQWEIIQKADILCNEHLEKLIQQCQFTRSESIQPLLIKYINHSMVSDGKPFIKIRLLNNMYYRYGFDQGLAIIFDDQYKITSVGVHNKSNLTSFGVKYNNQQLGYKIEEGVFDGHNTFIFDQPCKPLYKIGQLYCRHHLSQINFKNEIYKDPSEPYFQYHQYLLASQLITSIFSNAALKHNHPQQFQKMMEEQPVGEEHLKKYQKLQFPGFDMPTFKRSQEHSKHYQLSKEEVSDIIWQNSHRQIDTFEFERLSEKNRLQILRKEMEINLSHRTHTKQNEQQQKRKEKRTRIITMPPVDLKAIQKHQKKEEAQRPENKQDASKPNDVYVYELPKLWRQEPISNLEKHLDIRIHNYSEERQPMPNSKSRKKIFQQNVNLRKDYSPEASISPFKAKMKGRIFSKTPQRNQKSRSRSSKRIFSNTKSPQKIEITKLNNPRNQEPLSPHHLFETSKQQSESFNYTKTYPIPITNKDWTEQKKIQKQQTVVRNEEKILQKQKDSKIKLNEHLRNSTPTIKKDIKQEYSRKNNAIYKSQLKSQYGDYVFEPINTSNILIKQSGNMPYIMSNSYLSKNASHKTLQRQISKKSIAQSLSMKSQKMGNYMESTPQGHKQGERLSDFKRRVNYF